MVRRQALAGWLACLVGGLATLRVVLIAFLDRSPRFGGSEASHLNLARDYHRGIREALAGQDGQDFGFLLSLVQTESHQPPLWFVGVPGLFAGSASLSYGPLMLTNAAALALALWVAWRFGTRHGGPRTGLLSVVLLSCLPLVAGRVTLLGAEPWHMGLLGLSLGLFLRLREPDATRRDAVLLGGVVGVALLMKLTFFAALLGPALVEGGAAVRGGAAARQWRRRMLEAGAVTLLLVGVGFVPFTDLRMLSDAVVVEPSHASVFSLESVVFLLSLAWDGIGWFEVLLALLALGGLWLSRAWEAPAPGLGCRMPVLLLASVASVLAVHALIPHKEIRYLLPAAWSWSVLLALGLNQLWLHERRARWLLGLVLLGAVLTSDVIPQVETVPPEQEGLRFHLDRSDHGIDALVRHPSFRGPEGAQVLVSLADPADTWSQDTIAWELYGRNEAPVVVVDSLPSLLGREAGQLLGRASHVVSNRSLERAELQLLEGLGFSELAVVELSLSEQESWSLWARPDGRLPPAPVESP